MLDQMILVGTEGNQFANANGGGQPLGASDDQQRIAEARYQLATLARRKTARDLGWPRDWRPQTVRDPFTGEWFTDAGAWEFIADCLDAGEALQEIVLDNPPGKLAYVLHLDTDKNSPRIYIKVRLGAGKVLGISFHYSVHS